MSQDSVAESDLYPTLEKYFASQGYTVKGEVCGCDLVAIKADEIIVAELKKTFNIKLLYQAVRRLSITPLVYAAIFRPERRQKMSYWQMMKSLCRRLHIGLLVIDGENIQVIAEPKVFSGKINTRQKNKLLREFEGRKISKNIGGITGKKLQTAYLETAIHISVLLQRHKTMKITELVAHGCSEKSGKILYHNHYGWFQKIERGIYKLKPGQARLIAAANPEIWAYYETALNVSNS